MCVLLAALTRYSFIRHCCARINHPFLPPAHLHCLPWCNTIARLLDSISIRYVYDSPSDFLFLFLFACYTPYNIGNNNIV